MEKITLKAENRKVSGRKVKSLRSAGLIPANLYGKDVKSTSVTVDAKEFEKVFKKAGETSVVTVALGKEDRPVLIHNIQSHPVTGAMLHIDFFQVNLKQKVTANIPVEVTGESPVAKSGAGTVVILLNELEVESLPTDLPEKFTVDASKLIEVDQLVKVSDLKYDKDKVEIKTNPDEIVVKVEPPQKEEVVVAPVATETTVAEGAEAPKEGKTAATTEEKPAEEKSEAK